MATPRTDGKSGPPTVVFADNDPIVLEAITELLRTKGYEVHPTQDGLETLQAIRRIHPSYVILDIVMPKIDGSRVCWLVRQDPQLRHTPIIAFSALSPEQIRRFPELSADAYVAKGRCRSPASTSSRRSGTSRKRSGRPWTTAWSGTKTSGRGA